MAESYIQELFAERIGGRNYGKGTDLYKFEKIRRARDAAVKAKPDVALIDIHRKLLILDTDGHSTRKVPTKGFKVANTSHSPSPSFAWDNEIHRRQVGAAKSVANLTVLGNSWGRKALR